MYSIPDEHTPVIVLVCNVARIVNSNISRAGFTVSPIKLSH